MTTRKIFLYSLTEKKELGELIQRNKEEYDQVRSDTHMTSTLREMWGKAKMRCYWTYGGGWGD